MSISERWLGIRRAAPALICLCAMGGVSPVLAGDEENPYPSPASFLSKLNQNGRAESVMLVRAWDPKTGELVGWLPMHHLVLGLKRIAGGTRNLKLDEAIRVRWPLRGDRQGELRIAAKPKIFEGREWVPSDGSVNILYINKHAFALTEIWFANPQTRKFASSRASLDGGRVADPREGIYASVFFALRSWSNRCAWDTGPAYRHLP